MLLTLAVNQLSTNEIIENNFVNIDRDITLKLLTMRFILVGSAMFGLLF